MDKENGVFTAIITKSNITFDNQVIFDKFSYTALVTAS
jgi:hypothetical protein